MKKTTSPQIKKREEKGTKITFGSINTLVEQPEETFECHGSVTIQGAWPVGLVNLENANLSKRDLLPSSALSVLYVVYKNHPERRLSFVNEGSKWERAAWKRQGLQDFKTQINGHSK